MHIHLFTCSHVCAFIQAQKSEVSIHETSHTDTVSQIVVEKLHVHRVYSAPKDEMEMDI